MAKNLEITVLLDFYGDMLTPKQREAMRAASVDFVEHSIYEIVRNCLIRMLDDPK